MKCIWTENGVEAKEDAYEYDNYDLGWDRKWNEKDDYQKTGKWSGYSSYRPQVLSYAFITQMATSIAASQGVKIKVGKEWGVDLENKTLIYNPSTLLFSTKGEMLALLLHEVGKIKLCTPESRLKSEWFDKYKNSAYDVATVFDNFRVDDMMEQAYPSASEIYRYNEEVLNKLTQTYIQKGDIFRLAKTMVINSTTAQINELMYGSQKVSKLQGVLGTPKMTFEQAYEKVYGKKPTGKVKNQKDFEKFAMDEGYIAHPNIYDYEAVVVHEGYGLPTPMKLREDMLRRFELTEAAIPMVISKASTQQVTTVLETEVFPKIEDLLKNTHESTESMKDALGQMAAEAMGKAIKEMADQKMQEAESQGKTGKPNSEDGQVTAWGQKPGTETVPKEWKDGNYKELSQSVKDEVRSLTSKLTKIRRTEQTVKFEMNKKRGKLNTRSLYKHATGIRTLFKNKQQAVDTIRTFAFSILVDNSGSMEYNNRNTHTTRALVMLSEVFSKLDMPYEIIHFDTDTYMTKKFEAKADKKVQDGMAKYATESGGGTSLEVAIRASNLLKRPEMNKALVMLTDGGVNVDDTLAALEPFKSKGVKLMPIGLECGDEIESIGGRKVDMPEMMPEVFYEMLTGMVTTAHEKKI